VTYIEAKTRKNCLRWFGYIQRRLKNVFVGRIEGLRHDRLERVRGRFKKIWMEVIKRDMSLSDLDKSMTLNRNK
jgi:hypothetical protein